MQNTQEINYPVVTDWQHGGQLLGFCLGRPHGQWNQ